MDHYKPLFQFSTNFHVHRPLKEACSWIKDKVNEDSKAPNSVDELDYKRSNDPLTMGCKNNSLFRSQSLHLKTSKEDSTYYINIPFERVRETYFLFHYNDYIYYFFFYTYFIYSNLPFSIYRMITNLCA